MVQESPIISDYAHRTDMDSVIESAYRSVTVNLAERDSDARTDILSRAPRSSTSGGRRSRNKPALNEEPATESTPLIVRHVETEEKVSSDPEIKPDVEQPVEQEKGPASPQSVHILNQCADVSTPYNANAPVFIPGAMAALSPMRLPMVVASEHYPPPAAIADYATQYVQPSYVLP